MLTYIIRYIGLMEHVQAICGGVMFITRHKIDFCHIETIRHKVLEFFFFNLNLTSHKIRHAQQNVT